jgi:hypothetical protein
MSWQLLGFYAAALGIKHPRSPLCTLWHTMLSPEHSTVLPLLLLLLLL